MSKLLSLLKAAVGEKSISSRLGQWRLAVSRAIDGRSVKYVMAANTAHAQLIADLGTGTPVVLETVVANQGVDYDPATGLYTLEPHSFYELGFFPQMGGFNTEATDFAVMFWSNAIGNSLVDNTTSAIYPVTSAQNVASQNAVHIFYGTGDVAEQVHIRSAGGQGSASVGTDSYAFVRRIAKA